MTEVIKASQPAQADLLAQALGVKCQPFNPSLASSGTAPSSQTVFGTAVYGLAGMAITGVKIRNNVAAAGTLPTTVRFGIADATGKMLALSGNLNAIANWGTGVCPMPFTSVYTLPVSALYFPCFVVNGTWGTTQPTPLFANTGTQNAVIAADGSNPPPQFTWGGQTDLPAVGSSLTLTGANRVAYWLALY